MITNYFRRTMITIFCFTIFTSFAFAESKGSHTFKTILKFTMGNDKQNLLWLPTKTGGIPDGPFQGPMAFVTDKKGNLWIGDTLNSRIVAYDKKGKLRKEIDLLLSAKALKLASSPILLDFIPGIDGTVLVADAANNAVMKIFIKDRKPEVYRSTDAGIGFWQQINRIHCDKNGRVFIEDLPSMRTVVLKADGTSEAEALEGEVGIAVSAVGKTAMVVMDHASPNVRHLVLGPKVGASPEKIASLMLEEPIAWSSVIGFDSENNIHIILDTNSLRHYYSLNTEGKVLSHKTVTFPDPNYDPNRPDWIGPDGSIYTVKIEGKYLKVMHLE